MVYATLCLLSCGKDEANEPSEPNEFRAPVINMRAAPPPEIENDEESWQSALEAQTRYEFLQSEFEKAPRAVQESWLDLGLLDQNFKAGPLHDSDRIELGIMRLEILIALYQKTK